MSNKLAGAFVRAPPLLTQPPKLRARRKTINSIMSNEIIWFGAHFNLISYMGVIVNASKSAKSTARRYDVLTEYGQARANEITIECDA